jgi:hypothetical protein
MDNENERTMEVYFANKDHFGEIENGLIFLGQQQPLSPQAVEKWLGGPDRAPKGFWDWYAHGKKKVDIIWN